MGVEIFFKPEITEELAERIEKHKQSHGVTKVHMVRRALEMYMDVIEGKAQIVYTDHSHTETSNTRIA